MITDSWVTYLGIWWGRVGGDVWACWWRHWTTVEGRPWRRQTPTCRDRSLAGVTPPHGRRDGRHGRRDGRFVGRGRCGTAAVTGRSCCRPARRASVSDMSSQAELTTLSQSAVMNSARLLRWSMTHHHQHQHHHHLRFTSSSQHPPSIYSTVTVVLSHATFCRRRGLSEGIMS